MADTIGGIIDRLTIVNLKLWHVQDEINRYAAMIPEEFAGLDSSEIQATIKKVVALNLERSRLMTEADQCLDHAVKSGEAGVNPRIKIV